MNMKNMPILLAIAATAPILPLAVWHFFITLSLLTIIIGVTIAAVVKITLFVYSRRVMR